MAEHITCPHGCPGFWSTKWERDEHVREQHGAALPNPVSDTRDLGIQEERQLDAGARALYKAFEETTDQHVANVFAWAETHEDPDVREQCAQIVEEMRDLAGKVLAAALSTTIERDTVYGSVEDAAANLISGHLDWLVFGYEDPEYPRNERTLARAILALSPASTDIGALREALERIDEFVRKYFQPWGAWKTVWWEGEVAGDAAFSDNNALKHVANIAKKALSATPEKGV